MRIDAIEGNRQRLDGGAMYGNAPKAVWEDWSPPDERNRIELACRALLLRTDDGKTILFETGIGAFFSPKMRDRFGVVESEHVLLKSLAALGVAENDVDAVVLSHLHFDHAGGLLSAYEEGPLRLLFPKASVFVSASHWERALRPHSRDKASFIPELIELLRESGRLVPVGEGDAPAPLCQGSPAIRFRFSHGHTVGLMLSEILLPKGPVVFAADMVPGVPWLHVPITMGYDRYPELLIDEKRALLEDLVGSQGKLFLTHDPKVPCVKVVRSPDGRFGGEPVDLASLS